MDKDNDGYLTRVEIKMILKDDEVGMKLRWEMKNKNGNLS